MIKELIDNFFAKQGQDQKPQTRFYISDAGNCSRAIFFNFTGAPKKSLDPRLSRIFQKGTKIHNDVFSLLYQLPDIKLVTEVHIPEQPLITGRADAIAEINGENYVVDIKSINSFIFKGLTHPKPEDLYQIQLYLHFFNIKKGILFYMDKDRQEIREFLVNYDPILVHSLLANFKKLKGQIDGNEIPERLSDYPKNWRCKYCRFSSACEELDEIKK